MNGEGYQDLVFQEGESKITVRVHAQRDGSCRVELPDGVVEISGSADKPRVDGVQTGVAAVRLGDEIAVFSGGFTHHLRVVDPLAPRGTEEESGGRLTAPMPGRIVQVTTEKGATVKRGAALLILEAMKMEYTITAPSDGTVEEIRYSAGDVVDEGAELITFAGEA